MFLYITSKAFIITPSSMSRVINFNCIDTIGFKWETFKKPWYSRATHKSLSASWGPLLSSPGGCTNRTQYHARVPPSASLPAFILVYVFDNGHPDWLLIHFWLSLPHAWRYWAVLHIFIGHLHFFWEMSFLIICPSLVGFDFMLYFWSLYILDINWWQIVIC